MLLVLHSTSSPPSKPQWISKNAADRAPWYEIYEALTTWFCRSNDFRTHLNAEIVIDNGIRIIFIGNELRYLSPALRSAASLIDKAYRKGLQLPPNANHETTPGVIVTNTTGSYQKPWYHIKLNSNQPSMKITGGTVFSIPQKNSIELSLPASTLTQAIVWIHYGENGHANTQ